MIRMLKPAAALREFVRFYAQLEDRLLDRTVIQPVPARTAPVVEFTFGDPYEVATAGKHGSEPAHSVAVIGPQTFRRVELAIRGHVDNFVMVFQPGGLFRLFSIPPRVLTNRHFDGVAVLGRAVDDLAARLGECSSFAERASTVDRYLLRRCPTGGAPTHIAAVAKDVELRNGGVRMSDLAARTGLSLRQLERRFGTEIGLAPKLYARITRFEAALKRKNELPGVRWTDVAHDVGYHDQMHMVHDFRDFSGSTPAAMLAELGMFAHTDAGDA